ncbi:YaeQ family protein [Arenicella chitinivorans]|nr:YaeQ family protein [Arenicella chitinivorans]
MAIKPTIYKLRIALSDLERNYYDSLSLTVALHPSETLTRMMARVMAFCLNATPDLTFTKGLSEQDEPDIWIKSYDDKIKLWIETGEPVVDRVKKAVRSAELVRLYTFNSKTDVWWSQNGAKLSQSGAQITRFDPNSIIRMAELANRTMDCSVTITGQSAYVAVADGECEITWEVLCE